MGCVLLRTYVCEHFGGGTTGAVLFGAPSFKALVPIPFHGLLLTSVY